MSVNGYAFISGRFHQSIYNIVLTARVPNALRFLVVRGVFPLSLPGVLKTSVTLLCNVSTGPFWAWKHIQLTRGEDIRHVLIQPFQFIANRVSKLLRLLRDKFVCLFSFRYYPRR